MPKFGAIEAGGTKFVVAVGSGAASEPEKIARISTSHNPLETVKDVIEFFEQHGPVDAVGIATFGPVDFAKGTISTTPKAGWRDFPLRDSVRRALNVPVGFDTDVNGAALGEMKHGAGRGASSFVYVTVGTGIGGGAVVNGSTIHGLLHPEMGHLHLQRHPLEPEGFRGVCPYHGACLEGLASGPAIESRWNKPAVELPPEHPAWEIEADYLAQACFSMTCLLSPEKIVLGGGVMEQAHLFPLIRQRLREINGGYVPLPGIVAPGCRYPGLTGAFVLAELAAH